MPLAGFTFQTHLLVTEKTGNGLFTHQVGVINFQGNDNGAPLYIDFDNFKTNGEDFRIQDTDDSTLISHFILDWNNGAKTAQIYIKVPSLPAWKTNTYFIYGDNAGASSTSSYDTTMTKIVVEPTIQGLWPMDDGSTLIVSDVSANGYDITLSNPPNDAAWAGVDGGDFAGDGSFIFGIGDHLIFAGTDTGGVTGNSVPNLHPRTGNYSIQALVDVITSFTGFIARIGTISDAVFFHISSGKLVFEVHGAGGRIIQESDTAFADGGKHQVGASWNFISKTINLIVDGQIVPSSVIDSFGTVGDINPTGEPFALSASVPQFSGNIDELVVWSRELSQAEFNAHYFRRIFAEIQPTFLTLPVIEPGFYIPDFETATTTLLINVESYPSNRKTVRFQNRLLTAGNKAIVKQVNDVFIKEITLNSDTLTETERDNFKSLIENDLNFMEVQFDYLDPQLKPFRNCHLISNSHNLDSIKTKNVHSDNLTIRSKE